MCPILVVSNRIATLGAARATSLRFLIQKELPATKSRRWDNLVCNSMGIRVRVEAKNCLSVHTPDGAWASCFGRMRSIADAIAGCGCGAGLCDDGFLGVAEGV
jgi:hypothetical protein